MTAPGVRRWWAICLLWLGILLCLYAIWHNRAVAGEAISRISALGWAASGLLLVGGWLLSVTAWRLYLRAYAGRDPGWPTAARQMGLLLTGKYVPGGVFGFLARVYDDPDASRKHTLLAGFVEQAAAVSLSVALGSLIFLAAVGRSLSWLSLILALPWVALAGLWFVRRLGARVRMLRPYADSMAAHSQKELLLALIMQVLQLSAWVALVALLAGELYALESYAAVGIGGAFLLAVAAGMLALFVPGGIGVRELVLIGMASCWIDAAEAMFLAAILRILSSLVDLFAGAVATMISTR